MMLAVTHTSAELSSLIVNFVIKFSSVALRFVFELPAGKEAWFSYGPPRFAFLKRGNTKAMEPDTKDDSTVVFVITLSSLFFQLSELVEQLKAQLELEEVSDNPDNIATILTNLKHQGEATLDSIHTAIDEGETIIEELKLASSEGVDSSSLQHVEKVIKELDRVRRAIEHSWTRRRQQLELWLQLREFERSAKLVCTKKLINLLVLVML